MDVSPFWIWNDIMSLHFQKLLGALCKQGTVKLLDMYCVDFFENALFWSSGDTCCAPLPSSLLNELSMNKRYSNGFFSRRLVCRTCGSYYHSTGSSLVIANCQLKLCALFQGSSQKKIKEGWWFLDQSIFVVLTHSSDHIKENLL